MWVRKWVGSIFRIIIFISLRNAKSLRSKKYSERNSVKRSFNIFKLRTVLINKYKINYDFSSFNINLNLKR